MISDRIDARGPWLALLAISIGMLPGFTAPSSAQDKTISKSELKTLISTAHTQAGHQRIARYFNAEAAQYEADAKAHAELAQVYRKSGAPSAKYPGGMETFNHCDSISKSLQKAAENARQLAAEHRQMAKGAEKRDRSSL